MYNSIQFSSVEDKSTIRIHIYIYIYICFCVYRFFCFQIFEEKTKCMYGTSYEFKEVSNLSISEITTIPQKLN